MKINRVYLRKARRKDVLSWYKFLKKQMLVYRNIQSGFVLGFLYEGLPPDGEYSAARLLCFKNRNLKIIKDNTLIKPMKVLMWKFMERDVKIKYGVL